MSLRPLPARLPAPLLAALAGGALLLLLQATPGLPPLLEYRRDALAAEPWRLLTGHLVHVNWTHALVNAAVWPVLALLSAASLAARRQLLSLAIGATFISLALAAWHPSIQWYRGASGILHTLFFAGAAAALGGSLRAGRPRSAAAPLALLVGGWIKVVAEQPAGGVTPYAEWLAATTVPQAHLLGAIAGTALGALYAATAQRPPRLRR
ncbi:MAG: rhombosortase [Burkholderiaceae bacterium]|jgi:rhomboid family GlyGly-CTERM serine protease|nr:rhombosortase [Burkholderiaceae bacterium]